MTDFDHIAKEYDKDFTDTLIGNAQRAIVWKKLKRQLNSSTQVLEINCGTGSDAAYIESLGSHIFATDISPEMVKITQDKIGADKAGIMDIKHPNPSNFIAVNTVFSNFGGLNCISPDEWKDWVQFLQDNLPKNARVIFVIMSKNCWMENWYFKRKGSKIWNRNTDQPITANVEGKLVNTWYYSPDEIVAFMKDGFIKTDLAPVGLFIPPSYLEKYMLKHKFLFRVLVFLDKIFRNFSVLSKNADHFYIEFQKI